MILNLNTKNLGGIDFLQIPAGEYIMGSPEGEGESDEHPQHKVYVDSFWMGKYPVTQNQYKEIMDANPSYFNGDNLPVESISWNKIMEFCDLFNNKYDVKARLPFEGEWEYACRAGTTTKYYWGDQMDESYCWYFRNSKAQTHPVGQKKPNKWGLYDMSGNIWEWCMDWYEKNYYKESSRENPEGPTSGKYRVLRGGSWNYVGHYVRSANRFRNLPELKGRFYYGFRLVIPSL